MNHITILRALWQRRALVAVAAALSVVAGIVAAYHVTLPAKLTSRQYTVGVGQAYLLIDTTDSQVSTLGPPATGNTLPAAPADLAGRATLLANLVPTSRVKAAIAKRAGIRTADLRIVGPPSPATAFTPAPGPTQLEASQAAKANDRTANIVKITVPGAPDSPLPVISVQTQSPREQTAARLADATLSGLQYFLSSVPEAQRIPEARKIVLRPLGTAQVGTTVHGPSRLFALLLPFVLFTLACAAIVFVPYVIRAWREIVASEREETVGEEHLWPDAEILDRDDVPERVSG